MIIYHRPPLVITKGDDACHWLQKAMDVSFVKIQIMKKILFLTDAFKLNPRSVDFAAFICKLTDSSLTGTFLEASAHDQRTAAFIREEIACSGIAVKENRSLDELKQECAEHTISRFTNACDDLGVHQEVMLITDHLEDQVLLECRYADILLIDPALGLGEASMTLPDSFLRNVLSQAGCPVVMIPERFEGIDEIVFAYDGSPSAVFAIKQFTCMFPRLADRVLAVVTVHGEKRITQEETRKMKSWLNRNYSHIAFHEIKGDSRKGLLEYVLGKENVIIVMGAYGRSGWSAFFSPSHADPLVKYISKALFISHL